MIIAFCGLWFVVVVVGSVILQLQYDTLLYYK